MKIQRPFLFNGGVPVALAAPYTTVIALPPNIRPDGQLSLRNTHTSATMYFKWVRRNESTIFQTADAGIVLPSGIGWDTRILPADYQLVGQSSVADAVCAVDVEGVMDFEGGD